MSKKKKNHNILAIESSWDGSVLEPKSGMKALLEFITVNQGIRFSYSFLNTREEIRYILQTVDTSNFTFLYLGFHGRPNAIKLGLNKEFEITLEELAEIMGTRFAGYGVHFASCAVMDIDQWSLQEFKNKTGVSFLSGYSIYVDFDESSLMDLALINRWTKSRSMGVMFKNLAKSYKYLISANSFKYYI